MALLFTIPAFHTFYWSNPFIFVPYSVIAALGLIWGSRKTRAGLCNGRVKAGNFYKWVHITGWVLFITGSLAGIAAVSLAFAIGIDTGYWGGHYRGFTYYNGDYMSLGLQVYFLWATAGLAILGQGLLGVGRERVTTKIQDTKHKQ